MPVYTVEGPDGRRVKIEAADEATAIRGAQEHYASLAAPKPSAPQRPKLNPQALADASKRAAATPGAVRAINNGFTGNWMDELDARGAQLETMIGNVGDRLMGRKSTYTGKDAYDAVVAVERAESDRFAKERPVTNFALNVVGGAALPGSKFIGGATSLPSVAARSGALGAGYGIVAGAGADEGGLGDRLDGAAKGGATGLVFGAGIPLAARGAVAAGGAVKNLPVLRHVPELPQRVAGAVSEGTERLARSVGVPQVRPKITDKATRRAEEIVADIAKRRKVTPESIAADPYAARGATGAELLGREGVMLGTALGRRSGETADLLEGVLRPRMDARGQALADDLGAAAGLDPTFAAGDFMAQAGKARELADPLYQVAYGTGPVQSSRLDDLMRRPSVREAMKRAYQIAQEAGDNPETLGLRFANVAEDWANEAPTGFSADKAFQQAVAAARRGVQPDVSRGKSLTKFIADNGGLRDDGGELAGWDLDKWHADKAYQRKLVGPQGRDLDEQALRAWEAGYFPEFQTRPSPNQLLDALEAEMRGKPRFARDAKGAERAAMLDEAEELAARGYDGAPPPSPEDYVGRPEPRDVPVYEGVPTMQTWDYVKRGLDSVIEDWREPLTRRLNVSAPDRQATLATRQALHAELTNKQAPWGPAYRDALKAGGDPIRMEQAFRDAPKLFGPGVRVRDFDLRLAKMGEGEKQGLVAGLVDDLQGKADNGRLRPKDYANPAFRQKLERALGRDRAAQFLENLKIRNDLAATGGRMLPGTNSTTGEVSETLRDLDRDGSVLANIERRVSAGQDPIRAVPAGIVHGLVADPLAGVLRGFQAPQGRAVRDELGRILSSPDELAAALQSNAVRAAERPRIGAAGGGVPQIAPIAAAFSGGVVVRNGSGEPMGVQYEDGGFTPYDGGQPMTIEGREVVSYPDGTLRFRDTGEVAPL